MTFRCILVPVDMSEYARAGLQVATELARLSGGKLHLLNAYGLSPSEYPYAAYFADEIEREVANNSKRELVQWAARFAPADVEVHTSPKDAQHAILELAEELDADLIVMGTHGRRGLKHLLMGSVAEFVVRSAPCPVLTVGQPPEAAR